MQYPDNPHFNCSNMVTTAVSNEINSLLKILKCQTSHQLHNTKKDMQPDLQAPLTSSLAQLPSYALTTLLFQFCILNKSRYAPPICALFSA